MMKRKAGRWLTAAVGLCLALVTGHPAAAKDGGGAMAVAIKPADGTQNVPADALITLTFAEPVRLKNNRELTDKSILSIVKLVNGQNKRVPFTAKWDSKQRTITLDPEGLLEEGQRFTLTLLEQKLKDAKGRVNQAVTGTFTTRPSVDNIAPVAVILPGHGAKSVKLQQKITVQFAEEVVLKDGGTLSSKNAGQLLRVTDGQGKPAAYGVTWNKSKRTLSVKPKRTWQPFTTYRVELIPGVLKDKAGNPNPAQVSNFSTGNR
jgi:Bacterial Ig-like domain